MKAAEDRILQEVLGRRAYADDLFDALRNGSADSVRGGVTRDPYGEGEQFAHDLLASRARELGLVVTHDHMCNTLMTWPGRDPRAPAIVVGSHLDSVPGGGNFDGAAGVVAGLLAVAALKGRGVQPERDLIVMGIRAEESAWFRYSYIGSRGALGLLDPAALESRRIDTDRSLEDHLAAAGGDVSAVRARRAVLNRSNVAAFLEVHIEQAPSLAQAGLPIAVGTAIPGNFRHSAVTISGEYGHVGLPRRFRRDAALAGAEIFTELDALWARWDGEGRSMAFTIGEFHTNLNRHGMTTVPGEFGFSLDVRAYDETDLRELERGLGEIVRRVEARRSVDVALGSRASAEVAKADGTLIAQLDRCAAQLGVASTHLLSPASHDAAAFCAAGIPYGFLFVRNPNGSHHRDEAMATEDFLLATAVLSKHLESAIG